jgi:hypothetical protein
MLQTIKKTGEVIQYIGMAFLLIMAVVGTVAIDLVILAAIFKDSERRERNHGQNDSNHFFFTLLLWQMMFSNNNHHRSNANDYLIKLFLSPVTTGMAIALSFVLGVPTVGIYLALGWGVALATVGLGYLISTMADAAIEYYATTAPVTPEASAPFEPSVEPYVFGNRPQPSAPMASAVYENEWREAHASNLGFFSDSIPVAEVVIGQPYESAFKVN